MATPSASQLRSARVVSESVYSIRARVQRLFKIARPPGDRAAQAANVRLIARRAIHLAVTRSR